jgi:hypothetical protein
MMIIERCFGLKAPLVFMESMRQTAKSERRSDPIDEDGSTSTHLNRRFEMKNKGRERERQGREGGAAD